VDLAAEFKHSTISGLPLRLIMGDSSPVARAKREPAGTMA
jgi:hypothetical protein